MFVVADLSVRARVTARWGWGWGGELSEKKGYVICN